MKVLFLSVIISIVTAAPLHLITNHGKNISFEPKARPLLRMSPVLIEAKGTVFEDVGHGYCSSEAGGQPPNLSKNGVTFASCQTECTGTPNCVAVGYYGPLARCALWLDQNENGLKDGWESYPGENWVVGQDITRGNNNYASWTCYNLASAPTDAPTDPPTDPPTDAPTAAPAAPAPLCVPFEHLKKFAYYQMSCKKYESPTECAGAGCEWKGAGTLCGGCDQGTFCYASGNECVSCYDVGTKCEGVECEATTEFTSCNDLLGVGKYNAQDVEQCVANGCFDVAQ